MVASNILDIVGPTIKDSFGKQETQEVLKDTKILGLYFGASWDQCSQTFEEKLLQQYKTLKKQHKFEVIYVSSDNSEEEWSAAREKMPWYSLEWDFGEVSRNLQMKYDAKAIPQLILFDAETGNIITKKARSKIDDVENFPWHPVSILERLGNKFVLPSGETKTATDLGIGKKTIGIFFGAQWCPPARIFNKKLITRYETLKKQEKDVEFIFVSLDRTKEQFDEFHKTMPFPAVDYDHARTVSEDFNEITQQRTMPILLMLNEAGELINKNAKSFVSIDEECNNFPWAPPVVSNLAEDCNGIDDKPSIIIFTEEDSLVLDSNKGQKTVNALKKHFIDGIPEKYNDILLFEAPVSSMRTRIEELCGIDEESTEKQIVTLVDLAHDQYYLLPHDDDVNVQNVLQLMDDFMNKKITMRAVFDKAEAEWNEMNELHVENSEPEPNEEDFDNHIPYIPEELEDSIIEDVPREPVVPIALTNLTNIAEE